MLIDQREPEEYRALWPSATVKELPYGDYASDDMKTIVLLSRKQKMQTRKHALSKG